MEEDFYASVKLVSGEEIFGEVMPSEENGRTVLIISDPVEIETVSMNSRGSQDDAVVEKHAT